MKRHLSIFLALLMLLSGLHIMMPTVSAQYRLDNEAYVAGGYVGRTLGEDASYVAGVGDVDGDGKDDIAVGAPYYSSFATDAGRVYLQYGLDPNWKNKAEPIPFNRTIYAEDAGDYLGTSVAGAGDVDGDGYDDFLIGAPGNDTGGADAGAAYLVFGRPGNEWAFLTNWESWRFIQFVGESSGDQAGTTVAGGVDVNADGRNDIIIGAPYFDNSGAGVNNVGKVYVIYGHSGAWATSIDLSQADASYMGHQNNEQIGYSISGIYDLNYDGYDDIAIGSPLHDRAANQVGIVYAVFGNETMEVNSSLADRADASFPGLSDQDLTGEAVEGKLHLDGDEFGDLLIGSPGFDNVSVDRGAVYYIYGSDSGWGPNMSLSAVPKVQGTQANDYYGQYISAIGNVNGDRESDYAVGVPNKDYGLVDDGVVYLLEGRWQKMSGTKEPWEAWLNSTHYGPATNDFIGTSISGGDFNGDGLDDLVIGGPLANGTGGTWVSFRGNETVGTNQDPIEILRTHCWDEPVTEVPIDYNICVRLVTDDPNPLRQNVVRVVVEPTGGDPPLDLILRETNSGQFEANFTVKAKGMTNQHKRWVGTSPGETVDVFVYSNVSNKVSFNITKAVIINDTFDMIYGDDSRARLGSYVSVLGDINGDGIKDFAISASESSSYYQSGGAAYIYFGNESRLGFGVNVSDADVILTPHSMGQMLGSSIVGGDVNNDGLDDIIIGAPMNSDRDLWTGALYIIFGRTEGWSAEMDVTEVANVTYYGEGQAHGGGYRIASGADVNGDGIDDIVSSSIAAPSWNFTGWVYLIAGREEGWPEEDDLSNATARWKGADFNDWAGCDLDIKGDFTGDGLADILIGARNADDENGRVYVIPGRMSGWKMDWNLTDDYSISFTGGNQPPLNHAGLNVRYIGDQNRDMKDDIMIQSGEIMSDEWGGRMSVINTKGNWAKDQSISASTAVEFLPPGPKARMEFGGGIGDFNGDQRPDFFVGAHEADTIWRESGLFSIVYGRDMPLPSKINVTQVAHKDLGMTYWGWKERSAVGQSADSGDIDGDGWVDVIVGGARGMVFMENQGMAVIVKRGTNSRPTDATVLNAYANSDYTHQFHDGDIVDHQRWYYLELNGTDTDPNEVNVAEVLVTSREGDPYGIRLTLYETNETSGVFRGDILLRESAVPNSRILRTLRGDLVTISWVQDPSLNLTLRTRSEPRLRCSEGDFFIGIEDQHFEHVWTLENATAVEWNITIEDDFIHWDEANLTMSGTPNNTHVGNSGYTIEVTDDQGRKDGDDVFFPVMNMPPVITTNLTNLTNLTEDIYFEIDMNSSDDGQGNITWNHKTNATGEWFQFNRSTGMLNGTPTNDEVGLWWFNISVNDGNNGITRKNLTLNISNVNDLPEFLSTPQTSATEGVLYKYTPDVVDVDGDVLTFGLDQKPVNMTITVSTGTIEWTPDGSQVGENDVAINVSDGTGYAVQAFTINVTMKGVVPIVTLLTPENTTEVEVTNPELTWEGQGRQNATLEYGVYMSTNEALVRSLDPAALKANGTTDEFYRSSVLNKGATYYWTVIPRDGTIVGFCSNGVYWFKISEEATTNNAPTVSGFPPGRAYVDVEYTFKVNASDPDGDPLTFSFAEKPAGMFIDQDTGQITWRPTVEQVGFHNVTVLVSDGKASSRLTWTVQVLPEFNIPPELLESIENKTVRVGEKLEFTITAKDDNNDPLFYSLGPNSPEGADIGNTTGQFTWTPNEGQKGKHQIVVVISDGKDDIQVKFNVTVKEKKKVEAGLMENPMFLGLLVVIIVVVVLGAVFAMRRRAKSKMLIIDDIFLISKDGRLIHHHTRRLRPDMDGQLLGGMFTAVQDFIGTSFKPDEKGAVNEIRYGEYRVLIEHGKYIFIAVSAKGQEEEEVTEAMRTAIQAIEDRFADLLEEWDGDTSSLADAKKALAAIISGEDPKEALGVEEADEDEVDEEEKERASFQEKLKAWKDEGYNVMSLELVIDDDLETVRAEFAKFGEAVEKLKALEERRAKIKDPAAEKLKVYMKETGEIEKIEKAVAKLESVESGTGDEK
jgi:hypothetical protein